MEEKKRFCSSFLCLECPLQAQPFFTGCEDVIAGLYESDPCTKGFNIVHPESL